MGGTNAIPYELSGAAGATALRNPLTFTVVRGPVLVSVVGRIAASKFVEVILSIVTCSGDSVSEVGSFVYASMASFGEGLAAGEWPAMYFSAVKAAPIGLIIAGEWATVGRVV